MGSSETPSSSSACRADQESSHEKEPNPSSTSRNVEAFPFSCFKPKPKLRRDSDSDSDSDEVDKHARSINDDMEFISKVSEKIKDYEDKIPELKRTFNELQSRIKSPTAELADGLIDLQKNVTSLKEGMIAKEREAEALKKMIQTDQDFIGEVSVKIDTYVKSTKKSKEDRLDGLEKYGGTVVELRDLKRKVTKEKKRLISKHKDESADEEEDEEEEEEEESTRYDQSWSDFTGTANIKGGHAALEKMPELPKSSAFAESSVFKDFEARYNELIIELRHCLLCFSVFPENAEIKKRVMTYWWIGEGFVPPLGHSCNSGKTAEDYANDFFYELIAKDFIEPSSKLSSPGLVSLIGVKTCKMNPFVRSMVIMLAKRVKFFDFDDNMNVMSDYKFSHRACLTTGKQLEFNTRDLSLLYTLFNVSEHVLVFNPGLFRRMKYVKVLYLGRWQTWSTYHVDILFLDVLKELGDAKNLRFLSLQRMSKIMELPDTISKLKNLTILDIKACQNLVEIPNDIGSLVNLTHLDMSECYLLDHMPKGLSSLTNLEVLGGFVVGESYDSPRGPQCTLTDLQCMKKLRKLSIETGLQNFPSPAHLGALNKLGKLCKLTIAWARGEALKSSATADKGHTTSNSESKEKSPCFPWLKAPKCPWYKKNTSPKGRRAPEPPPATKGRKDNSAPALATPTKEANEDNSALELPPVIAEEAWKDSSAPEPPLTEEIRKDNGAQKPKTEEIGKNRSALEPKATNESAKAVEEVGNDSSSPKPPLAVEETRKDNSAPEPTGAKEVGKNNRAPEPTLVKEVPESNSAAALTGAEEIGKDNSTTEPAAVAEEDRKNNSVAEPLAAIEDDEKDNSTLEATSRVEEFEECKPEQEQDPPAEEKAATAEVEEEARTALEKKHVRFPWMKAPKRSRDDGTGMHDQSEVKLPLDAAKLPPGLEKLDLQCFPDGRGTENWLKPENLPRLKKLYIRGGKCFDLGANSGAGDEVEGTNQTDLKECWTVEVLRLKYLADLKMEWKELQRLFPKLSYLEMVNCPKLSFFPCDENGVWMKK